MYLYALRVPSFLQSISIAQVTMISEAYGGKRRDSFFKKLKTQSGLAYFSFFFFSLYLFFSLAIGMNSLSLFVTQMLFPILYTFFTVLIVSFAQKFTFDGIQFIFFLLLTAISKKPLLSSRVCRYTPKFSSKSVTILTVTFRSLINLGLIFGIGVM